MRLHGNARTCPHGRLLMVRRVEEEGWTLARAAGAAGVSVRTVSKWLGCYRADGEAGLVDGSSAPRSIPHLTSDKRVVAIAALRRLGMTAAEISECLLMPVSTVSAVLTRIGLGKRSGLEPVEPVNRYERKRPGELLHIDVKKLGRIGRPGHRVTGNRRKRSRGIGWEYVHVCVDDATRLAYVEVLEDEKATTAIGFLRRAICHYRAHGIRVLAVMTDNGSCYRATSPRRSALASPFRALWVRERSSGSSTYAPAPTVPKRTAKPSVSSAPCSAAGQYAAIYANSHRGDAFWLTCWARRSRDGLCVACCS